MHDIDGRVRAAWREVREYMGRRREGAATQADDPQPALAQELYHVWIEHRHSDGLPADRALAAAFQMWANSGRAEDMEAALPELDINASYWGTVLSSVQRAYARSGRDSESVMRFLHSYEGVLTHAKSRSALCELLGMRYWMTGDLARARKYYNEMAELAVDPSATRIATGAIYEFDALQPGQRAPEFVGRTTNGELIQLADQMGRAVLLDFWATHCGPCWPEMRFLREVRARYSESDLVMVGVSRDHDVSSFNKAIQEEDLAWLQIREPLEGEGASLGLGPIATAYNAQFIPRVFLIDPDGLIFSSAPTVRGERLMAVVDRMLR